MDVPALYQSPSIPSRRKQQSSSSQAVSMLSSPAAQTFAHIHPLLVLSGFAIRFQALVDDPVSALAGLLPAVCAVQAAYVIICLPAAGKDGLGKEKGKSGHKRRAGAAGSSGDGDSRLGERIVPAILSLLLTLLLGTPFLTILLVLFGAPVTTHITHTLLCAVHMSVLSGTSLVYVHGTDSAVWREIWAASRPVDSVWGAAVGTGLGAWLGAVPIPLDWDRPWQAYPITIATGAYLGYALGSSMGRTPLFYGKRIQFADEEEDDEDISTENENRKQIQSSENNPEPSQDARSKQISQQSPKHKQKQKGQKS
ncbi:glycosylphosphatidylinositol anchor biosynthesis protein 11 [Coccidioides immitis RS]|uniref:Glycosylphosphatidylinositol anchor biosynthesis protein 11 n=3 Tax=Coccidioides immitis TaxID=5501 RepID=J3KGH7_COCIM|nr:glycosylphosphatidylinositol anchor biosynthesis protein 11 [Coccidioides immitis RS]EAS34847.3 glycosylphosphatidylinositol anchor biosynthesis protein 11 [Coccidioides immitis RS]KMP00035.1 glycosylphosphatidylinositol anchor biosynthesis protein 11 [Coccidioides immitis RMSCC 2394]KMU92271.1 glycosylphosphatidylinositol anchor biosynthesis protein 11 [Coccidioides immitis H538.4]TPX26826.1 Glycosylphosphatidylinositol (GPI) anchor assembly protein [Coccidioides immitis]